MKFSVFSDERFMEEALKEAEFARQEDEIPIGAVVVSGNTIIARGRNMTEKLNDVTAHAEILAITSAAGYLGSKYLENCKLYVTIEPCPMCAGALAWAQIDEVIYGAGDPKKGFTRYSPGVLHPATKVKGGVLQEKCGKILTDFFKKKRI